MLKSKFPLLIISKNHLIDYPTPLNITYMWSFGALAGICLVLQIVTGVCLAMHYTPHVDLAFASVEHIMRDVHNGWLLRYLHANGASMFFFLIYVHIARGLYYSSYLYPRTVLWNSGVTIFFLMMATAFMGYVLPWGQMSFWGATVITNFFTAIPYVGESIAYWLWGGFSVNNATLTRFFSLHYLLPFLISGLVIVHLLFLHKDGSTNPVSLPIVDKISFYPYFYVKDLLSLLTFFVGFFIFVFIYPNSLGHSDNYIEANSMVTPAHIVPEWYFLPFYAILRSIPSKLGGVIFMGASILILYLVPLLNQSHRATIFGWGLHRAAFWLFIGTSLVLGFVGGLPVEDPYIMVGKFATILYFFYFLVILPGLYVLDIYYMQYFTVFKRKRG